MGKQCVVEPATNTFALVSWMYCELAEHVHRQRVDRYAPFGVGRAQISPESAVLVARAT